MLRISIWQQFSSNHSSSFTVIGEFQTEAEAQNAADEVKRWVQSIADYYAANPDAAERWNSDGIAPPTPPEFDMAKQFQLTVDEQYGLDWIWGNMPIDTAVVQLERLVFVTHPGDTWNGAYPFSSILNQLGSVVRIDGWQDNGVDHELPHSSTLIEQLTCTAPNEMAAQEIVAEIERFQAESRLAWSSGGKIDIPEAPWQPENLRWFQLDASTSGGNISHIGNQLVFSGWHFRKMAYGLPALVAYLRRKECKDIQFKLDSSVDEDD